MKTVDEKALGIIQKWRAGTYHNEGQANAALQVAIIEALKQQDRDTRHACANAVTDLDADFAAPTGTSLILPDKAAAACLRAKAI